MNIKIYSMSKEPWGCASEEGSSIDIIKSYVFEKGFYYLVSAHVQHVQDNIQPFMDSLNKIVDDIQSNHAKAIYIIVGDGNKFLTSYFLDGLYCVTKKNIPSFGPYDHNEKARVKDCHVMKFLSDYNMSSWVRGVVNDKYFLAIRRITLFEHHLTSANKLKMNPCSDHERHLN